MSESGLEIRTVGALGRITLNKPKALHALDRSMCLRMTEVLKDWAQDQRISAVLVDHQEGTRGFCAGGDIRLLSESVATDGAAARDFFRTEYKLNALIQGYPKPYIAIMDGITMGGGVGISVHGAYRIATENTVFAMPEAGIGLFPDVGGGWFLPRLPGQIGTWLALTGARLKAADCGVARIATHFVPVANLAALKAELAQASGNAAAASEIEHILTRHTGNAGSAPLEAVRPLIDRLFAFDRIEDILEALEADGSDWAKAQRDVILTKSPQSLKVALRQIRLGGKLSRFADNMKMEFRITGRLIMRPDFREGVRAAIIEKDNAPKWNPSTLAGVTDALLDAIFAPLAPEDELQL
jgi:enoyl-CoA hydratase